MRILELPIALAISHARCLLHAVSKATPMLCSHEHLGLLSQSPACYHMVKSFPALPIQQSKAVMITLSVVNHASVVSGAPMNVRLLVPRSPATPRIQRISAV